MPSAIKRRRQASMQEAPQRNTCCMLVAPCAQTAPDMKEALFDKIAVGIPYGAGITCDESCAESGVCGGGALRCVSVSFQQWWLVSHNAVGCTALVRLCCNLMLKGCSSHFFCGCNFLFPCGAAVLECKGAGARQQQLLQWLLPLGSIRCAACWRHNAIIGCYHGCGLWLWPSPQHLWQGLAGACGGRGRVLQSQQQQQPLLRLLVDRLCMGLIVVR
jgi:hypothetical protein